MSNQNLPFKVPRQRASDRGGRTVRLVPRNPADFKTIVLRHYCTDFNIFWCFEKLSVCIFSSYTVLEHPAPCTPSNREETLSVCDRGIRAQCISAWRDGRVDRSGDVRMIIIRCFISSEVFGSSTSTTDITCDQYTDQPTTNPPELIRRSLSGYFKHNRYAAQIRGMCLSMPLAP